MSRLLVIEDEPHFMGLSDWDFYGLPDGSSWVLVRHPNEIPEDLSEFDGILLDHRMPCRKGDQVAAELISRGIAPNKILRISSMREGEYPAGVEWIGKRLSARTVRQIFRFFAGQTSLACVIEAAQGLD